MQTPEIVTQTKTCLHCQGLFDITDKDMEFYDKISPTFAGEKFQIPTPTLCPDCRQQRRLSFRNERNLYKRKCDASGKDIISIYSPDRGYKVYDQKIRWSDERDPMDYGRDFDFTRTFTEQFGELMREVPRYNLYNFDNENSEYVQYLPHSKNCYLVFGGRYCSDCYYGGTLMECQDCIDCLYTEKCSQCYECIDCLNCTNCSYCFDCKDCSFSNGLIHCRGCQFCYNCTDLINQKYCIQNIQYGKEEYFALIKNQKIIASRSDRVIDKHIIQENCEHCSGNFLYNSKNIFACQQSRDSEDIRYSIRFAHQKDSMDIYGSAKGSLLFECLCCDYNLNSLYGFDSEYCQNSQYFDHCFQSNNLFGCTGLRNKSYCIFNKQYSKEDYEILVGKIIRHMQTTGERGEFFHPSLSPFGYNETVAQEYYPVKIEDQKIDGAKNLVTSILDPRNLATFGYHRSTYIAPNPQVDKVIDGKDLPSIIENVSDDISKSAIRCEITGKLFRITPQELAFYRKHHIPLPRKHPDQRHKERMELRK